MAQTITTEEEQEKGYLLIDSHNENCIPNTPRIFYISCGRGSRMFTLWSTPVNSKSIYVTDNYLCNLSTNFEKAVQKALTIVGKIYLDVDRDSIYEKRDNTRFETGKHAGKLISEVIVEDPGFIAWMCNNIHENCLKQGRRNFSKKEQNILTYQPEAIAFLREKAAEKLRGGIHVGTVGDKISLKVTLLKHTSYSSGFGEMFIHTFLDDEKNVIIYKGSKDLTEIVKKGEECLLNGTVKEHTEYNRILQTIILRPKVN